MTHQEGEGNGREEGFCDRIAGLVSTQGRDRVVRFFDHGDGRYTVHGETECGQIAARTFRTTTVIETWGARQRPQPTVVLRREKFEEAVRDLLTVQRRAVELHRRNGAKPLSLEARASPGDLRAFESLLWSDRVESAVAAALCFSERSVGRLRIGLATVDSTLRIVGLTELDDDARLPRLESALVQLGVRECFVANPLPKGVSDEALTDVLQRCSVVRTPLSPSLFKLGGGEVAADLGRLVHDDYAALRPDVSEAALALAALNALLQPLQLMQDVSSVGHYSLKRWNLQASMRLDAAAVTALNVFPGAAAQPEASAHGHLYGLLNQCRTAMGSRKLHEWLRQPLLDCAAIRARQAAVAELVRLELLRPAVQDGLRRISDLDRLRKRFQCHPPKATLEDIVQIYDAILRLQDLDTTFSQTPELYMQHQAGEINATQEEGGLATDSQEFLKLCVLPLRRVLQELQPFRALVEASIDMQSPGDGHGYGVLPSLDGELSAQRAALGRQEAQMKQLFADVVRGFSGKEAKALALEPLKEHGWVIRAPTSMEAKFRSSAGFAIIERTAKRLVLSTPRLSALSSEAESTRLALEQRQSALVREIVAVAATHMAVLAECAEHVATLDVLTSFAHVASHAPVPYCRPSVRPMLGPDAGIRLRQARHPCLEVQDGVHFVANDVELRRNGRSFLVLTGPNMGGKSTYIRMIGVIVLMAQVGGFVPADEAEMSVVDAIYSRIGAGDVQQRGISTFMAEMLDTRVILDAASPHSLVIIDEFGRGTSTQDGFGLTWALSLHLLRSVGCFTLFATHFHELTLLESLHPLVHNLHVAAETVQGVLVLLYRVVDGPSSRSFGIEVARMAKFPEEVLKIARAKAAELEHLETLDLSLAQVKRARLDPSADLDLLLLLSQFAEGPQPNWSV